MTSLLWLLWFSLSALRTWFVSQDCSFLELSIDLLCFSWCKSYLFELQFGWAYRLGWLLCFIIFASASPHTTHITYLTLNLFHLFSFYLRTLLLHFFLDLTHRFWTEQIFFSLSFFDWGQISIPLEHALRIEWATAWVFIFLERFVFVEGDPLEFIHVTLLCLSFDQCGKQLDFFFLE